MTTGDLTPELALAAKAALAAASPVQLGATPGSGHKLAAGADLRTDFIEDASDSDRGWQLWGDLRLSGFGPERA